MSQEYMWKVPQKMKLSYASATEPPRVISRFAFLSALLRIGLNSSSCFEIVVASAIASARRAEIES